MKHWRIALPLYLAGRWALNSLDTHGMWITACVIVAITLIVIVYDVFAAWKWGRTATVSWVLLTASQEYPIIAFAFGVLMGHLFAPQRSC